MITIFRPVLPLSTLVIAVLVVAGAVVAPVAAGTAAAGERTASAVRSADDKRSSDNEAAVATLAEPATFDLGTPDNDGAAQFDPPADPHAIPSSSAYVSTADGCEIDCIESALFYATDSPYLYDLEVVTDTPAEVDVWLLDGAPYMGLNGPLVDAFPIYAFSDVMATSWTTSVGLEPGTAEHVVVRATDADGDAWYEVGVFQVPQLPNYEIRLHWIEVLSDGDPGAGDAGELVFYWQFGDEEVQLGLPQSLDNGDVTMFGPADHFYAYEVGPQNVLPTVQVGAHENDGFVWECGDPGYDFEVAQFWGQDDCGNFHWNTATSGAVLAGDIDQLPLCSAYGVGGYPADHRCAELTTTYVGEQYPHFAVLVSFAQTN